MSKIISPSSISPSKPRKKPSRNEPNCPTIILPSRLAIIGKASPCSRMPGDRAVRNSVASISKRALRIAFPIRSNVIGSTLTFFSLVLLLSIKFAAMISSYFIVFVGLIIIFPYGSTLAVQSAWTSAVESISKMMAGPGMTFPALSLSRS